MISTNVKVRYLEKGEKMARSWTMHFRIEKNDSHRADITGSSFNTEVFYARTSDSDITGYKELVHSSQGTSQTDITASIAPIPKEAVELPLEEWISDAADTENETYEGANDWTYTAWWSKSPSAPNPLIHSLKCQVFRRNSGGSEFLITSFTKTVTTTETVYDTPVTVDEEFGSGDRLVIKWIATFRPNVPEG